MKYTKTVILQTLALFVLGQLTHADDSPPDAVAARERAAARLRIEEALSRKIDFQCDNVPLVEAIDQLSRQTKVTILIEPDHLHVRVSGEFRKETLREVLEKLLPTLFVIRDEAIVVTDALTEDTVIRVYHVGLLLKVGDESQLDDQDWARFYFPSDEDGGFFCGPPDRKVRPKRRGDWLRTVIMGNTAGPWMLNDGCGGRLGIHGEWLVVRNTKHNQVEIRDLIDVLERVSAGAAHGGSWPFSQRRFEIEQKLIRRISVDYQATPLNKVCADLAQKAGVQFEISLRSFEDDSRDPAEPVSHQATNVSIRTLLKHLAQSHELFAVPGIDRVHVVSSSSLCGDESPRLYDVGDVVDDDLTTEQLIEMLIAETNGPWLDVDGAGGTILPLFNDILLIRILEHTHEDIADLLHQLRTATSKRPHSVE